MWQHCAVLSGHAAALCCAEQAWDRGGDVEVAGPVAAGVGRAGGGMRGDACATGAGVPDVARVTVVVELAGRLFHI